MVLNNGGSYTYRYNLSDLQMAIGIGNVRTSFDIYGGVVRILQRDDYYAFGLRKSGLNDNGAVSLDNRYLYNGKELQDELEQYDYGARFYDPVIGRFNTVDLLSEKSRRFSPYSYAVDNPIRFIDVDGMYVAPPDEYVFNHDGKFKEKIAKPGENYIRIANTNTTFKFADPKNDAASIDKGEITKLRVVSDYTINGVLEDSGVFNQKNQESRFSFILNESNANNPKGSGKMDYVITAGLDFGKTRKNGEVIKEPISADMLYVTMTESGNVAHNNYNFGNFLWGAGAHSLGFPEITGRVGAHAHNFFNDPNHKGKLDSKDDQYSIHLGYEWKKPK
ncbi:RHS repeat domain-containing protein [Pedobacter helvus]|uniref:RHS repeat domain-containing protein n=1 Tax=Pedobacter helvus TaxID=2563444 RepID=A0ABW9JEN8_9SPHI|nr:RHS repeat-associated core domain-containing protein [Pedobacter ureilyticus]